MCSTDATRAMPKHFGSDTHSPQWYDAPTTAISGANFYKLNVRDKLEPMQHYPSFGGLPLGDVLQESPVTCNVPFHGDG